MVAGYHLIWTANGWWLPNDPRGSSSHEVRVEAIAELGELHFGRKPVQPAPEELRTFYQQAASPRGSGPSSNPTTAGCPVAHGDPEQRLARSPSDRTWLAVSRSLHPTVGSPPTRRIAGGLPYGRSMAEGSTHSLKGLSHLGAPSDSRHSRISSIGFPWRKPASDRRATCRGVLRRDREKLGRSGPAFFHRAGPGTGGVRVRPALPRPLRGRMSGSLAGPFFLADISHPDPYNQKKYGQTTKGG